MYIECNCTGLNHFQSAPNQQQNEGLEAQVEGEQDVQTRKTQVSPSSSPQSFPILTKSNNP